MPHRSSKQKHRNLVNSSKHSPRILVEGPRVSKIWCVAPFIRLRVHLDHRPVLVECEPPYRGSRQVVCLTRQFCWQIYDYVEVQFVHNATFAAALPPTFLQQARDLANWHEYYVFSSPNPKSINTGAYIASTICLRCVGTLPRVPVAAQTLVPSITGYINQIVNSSDPLKFAYTAASYKPFISLFNVTGISEMNNTLAGVGKYLLSPQAIRLDMAFGDNHVHFLQSTSPRQSHSKSVPRHQPVPSSDSTSRTARTIRPTTPTESWVRPPETLPSKPSSTTYLQSKSTTCRNGATCVGTTIPVAVSSCRWGT